MTSVAILLAAVGVTIHLFMAYSVFASASEHGMNPMGWTVLYLLTGPVGWIVFMIARSASAIGVSGDACITNVARKRLVDDRRLDNMPLKSRQVLPRPSQGFSDPNLADLIAADAWDKAQAHVNEMIALAAEDGNRSLVDDYRRISLWIDAKVNPFHGG